MFMDFSPDGAAGTEQTPLKCGVRWKRETSRRRLQSTSSGGGAIEERLALYTATLAWTDSRGTALHAFYAMVEVSDEAAYERLEARLGRLAQHVNVRRGFDPAHPLAISMLSEAVSDMLLLIEASPTSPLAKGLDLLFEQRFLA